MTPSSISSTSYSGEYSFGSIGCHFHDFPYQNIFGELFGFEKNQPKVSEKTGYSFFFSSVPYKRQYTLSLNGRTLFSGSPFQLLGVFDSILDQLIRTCDSEKACTMHASSVAINENCFSFVGESCSGKTTLATKFALCSNGMMLGDEYAVFNYKTGAVFHECYPLMLKRDSPILAYIGIENAVPFIISKETERYAISYSQLDLSRERRALPLKAIIFPKYNSKIIRTRINNVSLTNLHCFLLPSIGGSHSRVPLYRAILNCISRNKIKLISIEYSFADEACIKLIDFISQQ